MQTTQDGDKLSFNLGALGNGALTTITILVDPARIGNFTNSATVAADLESPTDPDPGNNSSSQTATVVPAVDPSPGPGSTDVGVTASGGSATVSPGQNLVYTVTVKNLGSGPANDVVVFDTLPGGVTIVSVASSQGKVTSSQGSLTVATGTLAPGAQATVTITVAVVHSTGSLVNTVRASDDGADINSGNNVATVTTAIVAAPVTMPNAAAPSAVSGRRLGYHHLPTTLVLTFDTDVNRKAVENLSNYKIVGPKGNIIPLKSAAYDASKHQVRLRPLVRLTLREPYMLTVKGEGPAGVASAAGALPAGPRSGLLGRDYVARVLWWKMKPVASTNVSTAALKSTQSLNRASSRW